jgi:hypothetical protein
MQTSQPPRRRGRPPKVRIVSLPTELSPIPGEPSHEEIQAYIAKHPIIPADWVKGQLLNVRHAGAGYRVTLLGEEYDPRSPERCLEFSDGFQCQQFVSDWYNRQSCDPRA